MSTSLLLHQYVKEKHKQDRERRKQKIPLQIHERKTNYWNNLCFLISSQNSFRTKFPKLGSPRCKLSMQTARADYLRKIRVVDFIQRDQREKEGKKSVGK